MVAALGRARTNEGPFSNWARPPKPKPQAFLRRFPLRRILYHRFLQTRCRGHSRGNSQRAHLCPASGISAARFQFSCSPGNPAHLTRQGKWEAPWRAGRGSQGSPGSPRGNGSPKGFSCDRRSDRKLTRPIRKHVSSAPPKYSCVDGNAPAVAKFCTRPRIPHVAMDPRPQDRTERSMTANGLPGRGCRDT